MSLILHNQTYNCRTYKKHMYFSVKSIVFVFSCSYPATPAPTLFPTMTEVHCWPIALALMEEATDSHLSLAARLHQKASTVGSRFFVNSSIGLESHQFLFLFGKDDAFLMYVLQMDRNHQRDQVHGWSTYPHVRYPHEK